MFKKHRSTRVLYRRTMMPVLLGLFGVISILTSVLLLPTQTASAATNNTINFQARLLTSAGAVVPDGSYNVEFKLYNAASSSGSSQGSCSGDANCLWVETRTGANTVTVKAGYLSVQLGSVTAFPTTINWDQNLWLTMNIGGIGTPSWDGEMTPRLAVTAVPYAFRAGQLASLAGSNEAVLQFASSFGQATNITLPDPGASSATVCYQTATACGFAVSTGSTAYIQNGTSPQASANFNISGSGTIGTNLTVTGTFNTDTLSSTALTFSGASPTISASTTNTGLNVEANGTGTLLLDTTGAGTVSVGTTATTVSIGGGTANKTVNVGNSSGINGINIGTVSSAADTISEGSSDTSTSVTMQGGASKLVIDNSGNTFTGNVSASGTLQGTALTTTGGGQDINFTGPTSNYINFENTGTGVPVLTTRSAGTKIVLYNDETGSTTDYALGISSGVLWNSVPANIDGFQWWGGNTEAASLGGTGNLTLGTSNTGTITAGTYNTDTLTSTSLTLSGAAPVISASTTNTGLTLQANGSGTLVLGNTTGGTINLGTASTTAIGIGNTSAALTIDSSATANLFNSNNAHTINIGAGGTSAAENITIGSTGSSSTVSVQAGAVSEALTNTSDTIETSTNSTNAFQVQNAASSDVLDVDTTNSRVGIGISAPTNTLSVSPVAYSTGTATQSGTTTITGSGTTWTSAMVGDILVFANGASETIMGFTSTTSLTGSASLTETAQAYTLNYPGLQVTSTGNTTVGGNATFQNATNSTTAFQVQNASGSSVLSVDTQNTILTLGTSANNVAFNPTSGTPISCTGNGCQTKKIILTPEYAGAVLDTGSQANDVGTMIAGFDSTQRESFYQWTTAQATNQSYDVVAQIPVPSDFKSWGSTTPITVDIKTSNTTNGTVKAALWDTTGTVESNWTYTSSVPGCSLTPGSTSWTTQTGCTVSGTYAANGIMTLRIRVQAPTSGITELGNIVLTYVSNL
jgi:hypothetical protein